MDYWGLRDYGEATNVIWDGDVDCKHEWNIEEGTHKVGRDDAYYGGSVFKSLSKDKEKVFIGSNICAKCGAWNGQLGLEPHPQMYINHIVTIMREVHRVLKDTGTLWLNIGDTYCGGGTHHGKWKEAGKHKLNKGTDYMSGVEPQAGANLQMDGKWLQAKQQLMIPERIAIAMQNDGWIKRNTIIWYKPNAMPSCLHPNTKVFVKRKNIKQISISNIKIGDNILSPTGWKKVLNKWIVKRKGMEFQYGTTGKVIAGENHKFPISHDNRRKNYDIVKLKDIKIDKQRTQRLLYKPIFQFLNKKENDDDYNLGRLLGLIVADGGFNSKYPQGKITLHKKEIKLAKWVKYFLGNRFKLEKLEWVNVDNYQYIQFYSYELRREYRKLCKGKCVNKSLNLELILNSSYSFRRGIFDGIIEGDGYIDKNGRIVFGSASKQLRDNMGLLASSIGLLYSIHESHRLDKRTNKYYNAYFLTIPISLQKEVIKGERTKFQYYNRKTKEATLPVYRNEFFSKTLKITNLRKIDEYEMIDIEVEDGLFIIENGLVSHNSVKDRLNTTYEPIFMFSKERKYYFDLDSIRVPHKASSIKRWKAEVKSGRLDKVDNKDTKSSKGIGTISTGNSNLAVKPHSKGKNPGDLWSINTKGFKGAHFAVYPTTLIERILKCSGPREGIALDPFMGSGTTGLVAKQLGLNWIGIELNKEYAEMAIKRIGSGSIKEYNVNREKIKKIIEKRKKEQLKFKVPIGDKPKCPFNVECKFKVNGVCYMHKRKRKRYCTGIDK